MTKNDQQLERLLIEIYYHFEAYWLDEGDYQPTFEEAMATNTKVLRKFIKKLKCLKTKK